MGSTKPYNHAENEDESGKQRDQNQLKCQKDNVRVIYKKDSVVPYSELSSTSSFQ